MSNISLLKNQHSEILAVIKSINTLVAQNLEGNATDIAHNINALSGKLKMHLMSEDQFLYPNLMQSKDKVVSTMAHNFNIEMGDLAGALGVFVQKYNTPFKILENRDAFVTDSKNVFQQITSRIQREDSRLYPLLER